MPPSTYSKSGGYRRTALRTIGARVARPLPHSQLECPQTEDVEFNSILSTSARMSDQPRVHSGRGVRCQNPPSHLPTSPLFLWKTTDTVARESRCGPGCHGLPKDIGSQSGVPRHQRVCQLYGTGFGDEMHLVFECAAMTDLRGQFPDIFQPHQTMQQFMWQPNLLQVAKFLNAGMKRLQTVDLNEGSNI